MQDNLHEDLFSDHAWNEMRKVLDREMPERKRRGAFWLWFLPALGLCVLLGRDSLVQPKIPVATEKAPVENAPIAQHQQHTVKNAEQNSKNTPEDPTSAAVQPGLEVNSKAIATLKAPVAAAGKSQASNKAGTINATATQTTQDTELSETAKVENTPLATQSETQPGANATSSEEKAVLETQEEEAAWTSSQMLAQRAMALSSPAQEPEPISITPARIKQKLEWWADAGTQFALGINGLSGYRAGISTGIPMGRLRVQTGLGYEQTVVGIQSVQRDVLTGKENYSDVKLASPGTIGLGSSVAGRNDAESISSLQLRFVNWHLGLQYPLTRRLGLNMGGNVHYLESVKLGTVFIKDSFLNFGADQMDVALSNNGNQFVPQQPGENLSSESFRNFGFSAQLGFSYRLTPRWTAMLDYRQSLQHFTKADNLLLKPNWIDIGIRYRIK